MLRKAFFTWNCFDINNRFNVFPSVKNVVNLAAYITRLVSDKMTISLFGPTLGKGPIN